MDEVAGLAPRVADDLDRPTVQVPPQVAAHLDQGGRRVLPGAIDAERPGGDEVQAVGVPKGQSEPLPGHLGGTVGDNGVGGVGLGYREVSRRPVHRRRGDIDHPSNAGNPTPHGAR